MDEGLAKEVFAVIRQGLNYREQLNQKNRTLTIEQVQADLRGKLGLVRDRPSGEYLGIRYPLVCWIDEIFTESPWRREWQERKLEWELYKSAIRADLFWEQAAVASARTDADALEVFYLCVLLGFRGNHLGKPAELRAKCEQFRGEIGLKRQVEWPNMPASLPPPETEINDQVAMERLRWLLLATAIVISGLIIAGSFALWTPLLER